MEFLTTFLVQLTTFLTQVVTDLGVVVDAAHPSGLQYLGAAIAVFTGFGSGIGEGMVAAKAMEAIGRQPEASGKITVSMIIGQAVAETTGLYGLVVAIMLLNK